MTTATGKGVDMFKNGRVFNLPPATLAEIDELSVPNNCLSIYHYFRVYATILLLVSLSWFIHNFIFTLIAIILIAGRQHSLYILNHDASHNGLLSNKVANKWAATVFSNFAMFHHPSAWSFVQWQRTHYSHHRELFTHNDPNYTDRENSGDTLHRLTASALFKECIKAGVMAPFRFIFAKQDYTEQKGGVIRRQYFGHLQALFYNYKNDREMRHEQYARLFFYVLSLSLLVYFHIWFIFLILWIVPMYTVFPMILTYMDLTEHRWDHHSRDPIFNTRSIHYGFISKMLLSFLPRGLHCEHHLYPRIVSFNLPKLSRILCTGGYLPVPKKGVFHLLKELRG